MSRSYKNPPEMRDDLLYVDWKRELAIWTDFTDLDKNKQGPAVFLTLKGKARETVLADIDITKLKGDDGVKCITDVLDSLYVKNAADSAFSSFDNFITFKRPASMSIKDYLIEFNLRLKKVQSHKMELPEGIQAYYLLYCANLTAEQTSLCRATCSNLTFKDMKEQIERVSPVPEKRDTSNLKVEFLTSTPGEEVPGGARYDNIPADDHDGADETQLYDDGYQDFSCADTYFNKPGFRPQYRQSRGGNRGAGRARNRPDEFGNPTECRYCKSVCHWIEDCPHAPDFVRGASRDYRRGGTNARGHDGYRGGYGRPRGGSSTQYYF